MNNKGFSTDFSYVFYEFKSNFWNSHGVLRSHVICSWKLDTAVFSSATLAEQLFR